MLKSKHAFPLPYDSGAQPVVCATAKQVIQVANDGRRKRPVCAINENGDLVVCCNATAKAHGWEVQGKLYDEPSVAMRNAIAKGRKLAVGASGELVEAQVASRPTKRLSGASLVRQLLGV